MRVYSPTLGRWMTRDPSGEGNSPNLYDYCEDDPINKHDPTGLASEPTTQPVTTAPATGPSAAISEDAVLAAAINSAYERGGGKISPEDFGSIPMNETQAIKLLKSMGRRVFTQAQTRAFIDEKTGSAEGRHLKDTWEDYREKYPGKSDDEIVALETAKSNIISAKTGLVLANSRKLSVYVRVVVPVSELLIMSSFIPGTVGAGFKPTPMVPGATVSILGPAAEEAEAGLTASARQAASNLKPKTAYLGYVTPEGKVGFVEASRELPGHIDAVRAGLIPAGSRGFSIVTNAEGKVGVVMTPSTLNVGLPGNVLPLPVQGAINKGLPLADDAHVGQ